MIHFFEGGVSTYIIWNSYLCQYEPMDIYFVLWFIMQYYLILFAQIFPDLATGSSFYWLSCPFDISPSICLDFLSTSLHSDTKKIF